MGNSSYQLVVVGGSTGSISVTSDILAALSVDFPIPIIVVLHRQPVADTYLTQLLQRNSNLTVKEADEKEYVGHGIVYIAPANYHLLVERDLTLSLTVGPKVMFSRPSIDLLFETAAWATNGRLIGILLSGANRDGVAGLQRIQQMGGITIVQTPATAKAREMPQAAIDQQCATFILDPHEIVTTLEQQRLIQQPW